MEEENINSILSQYNINVLNIKNECDKGKKAVWWIKTTGGDKILKKRKDVQFEGDEKWINRHEYSYSRKVKE